MRYALILSVLAGVCLSLPFLPGDRPARPRPKKIVVVGPTHLPNQKLVQQPDGTYCLPAVLQTKHRVQVSVKQGKVANMRVMDANGNNVPLQKRIVRLAPNDSLYLQAFGAAPAAQESGVLVVWFFHDLSRNRLILFVWPAASVLGGPESVIDGNWEDLGA
jgi:hypothetical protein